MSPSRNLRNSLALGAAGGAVALAGMLLLLGVLIGVYDGRLSPWLLRTGIPVVLLSELAGLAAVFGGVAIVVGVFLARGRTYPRGGRGRL